MTEKSARDRSSDRQDPEATTGAERTEGACSEDILVLPLILTRTEKILLFASVALISIVLFLDNSTANTYVQYAASQFNGFSLYATLSTSSVIVCLIIQTPLTKMADVVGRAAPYTACILFLAIAFSMMATAPSMNLFAGGMVLWSIGSYGILVLGQVIVSDYTSSRARTLGIALFYAPNIVVPFIASIVVKSVITDLSWRWGFRIFAILYPSLGIWLVCILFYLEHKEPRTRTKRREKMGIYEFFSRIDFGGNLLIIAGFGLTLLPLTLAGTALATFHTPYIIALLVIGIISLCVLFAWESRVAAHPILPSRYFKNKTIVLVALLGCLDYFANNVSHVYLYSWAIVARNMDIGQATRLQFMLNVVATATMFIVGLFVFVYKQYKWVVFVGCIIRTIGYGVMVRFRGVNNSIGEVFAVQVIQGLGTGIMEAVMIPAVQFVVPHSELAQVTGVLQLFRFTGTVIGVTVAGAIYNNFFRSALRHHLPPDTDEALLDSIYNSVLGVLPDWGSPERLAISDAYGDIMRYMVIAAVAVSAPMFLFSYLLPNLKLSNDHNLVENVMAEEISDKQTVESNNAGPVTNP